MAIAQLFLKKLSSQNFETMKKIAIIGGSSFFESSLFSGLDKKQINTKYGFVDFFDSDNYFFVQRHTKSMLPPHMINHKANLSAIKSLNPLFVLAINSTGSLKPEIKPGDIVIPHDFMQLSGIKTFFDENCVFSTPEISTDVRKVINASAKSSQIKILNQGVYLQTQGPRFETKAEVKFYSTIADLIGMTLADEATLAKELNLDYASICCVDNYANGILNSDVANEDIISQRKTTTNLVLKLVSAIIDSSIPLGDKN